MLQKDQYIVRELAKRYMELALSEKQKKAYDRMQATNDLKLVRPPVLMDEIPWYQMDIGGELVCRCEEERAREAEAFLRRALYREKYFCCDALAEPFWRVRMAYDSTGNGLQRREEILRTDAFNNIVSHRLMDALEDEETLEKAHAPQFTLRPDVDAENMDYYTRLFGDAMPVRLAGPGYDYFMPWDLISFLRGVEPIYTDVYDRPDYLHRLMRKFCDDEIARLDFLEANMPIDTREYDLHCTPGMVSGLGQTGWKATWFRGAAQLFSSVSPAVFKEFEIDYVKPIAERFGYTYYGCCEPLHDRLHAVKSIKNLRKIGVSPWADIEASAEQIGGSYVYARKPNPAHVAVNTDEAVVRKEIEDTVKVCIKYGCPCEFVLKDISTVSGRPDNLIRWARTVKEVLDKYYGE